MSRLDRLFIAIADRPDGEKVNIPALIRAFTPTQAETVAAIEHLIATGRLDAKTLRRPIVETQTTVQRQPEPTRPPELGAAEGEGGASMHAEAPPSGDEDIDRLLACFSDEFEQLAVIARRFRASTAKIVKHAQLLRAKGSVESDPPKNGRPYLLWRRARTGTPSLSSEELAGLPDKLVSELSKPAQAQVARAKRSYQRKTRAPLGDGRFTINQQNTKGAPGTAREAPGATESTVAERIEDRAPANEPAPRNCPPASAHPVGIKVNGPPTVERKPRRDPTQPPEMPLTELRDRQVARGHQHAAAVRRGQEAEAIRLLDQGVDPSTQTSFTANLMRAIVRRRVEEARLADPIEQAKAKLRKRFRPVVSAEFADPPGLKGTYLVGRKIVTEQELLAMAGSLAA